MFYRLKDCLNLDYRRKIDMTAEVKVEEKQVESEVVIASAVVPPVEETTVKAVVEDEVKAVEEVDGSETKVVEKSSSFKEESDFFSDLMDSEKKALSDLKTKLEEAGFGKIAIPFLGETFEI